MVRGESGGSGSSAGFVDFCTGDRPLADVEIEAAAVTFDGVDVEAVTEADVSRFVAA